MMMVSENLKNMAKNLAKEAPRSPSIRLGGYAILSRTIDKCRAAILNQNGEYHFDCPMDKTLFSFKKITGDQFRSFVEQGKTDDEVLDWLNKNGEKKNVKQIKEWSDSVENDYYYKKPDKKEWFASECERLGLNPETTTLFDYLNADDKASFN